MAIAEEPFVPTVVGTEFGTIAIRVVVLPRKAEQIAAEEGDEIVDLAADETLVEEGSSPVGSYLERQRGGKLCCVFLVNGQRQDGLDNSFIVQQLAFKYLRKRMMIIVDVDGLQPEALGDLMQGSRQGFFRGRVWEAIFSRLTATLKGDPELVKLEEEAEAEVTQLQAGEQRVKETLDALIESHHQYADHVVIGLGLETGNQEAEHVVGARRSVAESVVSLGQTDEGAASDYPVLVAQPDVTRMSVRPGVERTLQVTTEPRSAWTALTSLSYELDSTIAELHIGEERTDSSMTLRLRFDPPGDFDEADYPLRTTLRVSGHFNEFKEPRQLTILLIMAPANPPPDPELFVVPTFLKVTSRQPVRIWKDDADTHVRLRWNGRDDLPLPPMSTWAFAARCLTPIEDDVSLTFSQPRKGRFSILVGVPEEAELGSKLKFEVRALGPEGRTLRTEFEAVIAERLPRPQPEPRLIASQVALGAARRPPYELKYVYRNDWDNESNFGGDDWSAADVSGDTERTHPDPSASRI